MNSKKHIERLTRKLKRETKSLKYRTKRLNKLAREIDVQKQFELAERGKL